MCTQTYAIQGSTAVRASLWMQEDSHCCGALQTGEKAHQGKQMSPGDDGVTHAAVQVTGARAASGQGAIYWCEYPGPGPV